MSRLTRYHQESLLTDEGGYCEPNASNYYDIVIKLGQIEDILEEYGIDSIEELELIMQENQKYKHLKYELGCPLNVVFKALKNGIIDEENKDRDIMLVRSKKGYWFREFSDDLPRLWIKDYKKTWWLTEDLSE